MPMVRCIETVQLKPCIILLFIIPYCTTALVVNELYIIQIKVKITFKSISDKITSGPKQNVVKIELHHIEIIYEKAGMARNTALRIAQTAQRIATTHELLPTLFRQSCVPHKLFQSQEIEVVSELARSSNRVHMAQNRKKLPSSIVRIFVPALCSARVHSGRWKQNPLG